ELDQFNTRFLAAPERQRKLEFSRSLRQVVDASHGKHESSISLSLLDIFRYRPALAFAISALIVLMAIGTGWSAFEIAALRRELHSTQFHFRALEESVTASPSSPSPALLAVNLLPGLRRSSNDLPKLLIGANSKLVQFSLTLLRD